MGSDLPECVRNATILCSNAMKSQHTPVLARTVVSTNVLFAALFAAAYTLLLVDLSVADRLAHSALLAAAGACVVLLGTLGFTAVERHGSQRLAAAYFALQLPLAAAIFPGSTNGSTFLLLVIVAQSVRVLPLWATLLIGAPLPLLHAGMDWPHSLRDGGTLLVALVFTVALSQALMSAERARAALAAANRQLRDYAAQREELATARERNRIARDIHDGLGHYLTTIHMQIQAARSILDTDRVRAEQTLTKAQQLAQEALGDVRRSVSALRAAAPDHLSLPASLTALAEAANSTGLPTTFALHGAARPVDPLPEQALFRAAQEGLTNARKHAAATHAILTLDFGQPQRVVLMVADNGQGASMTDGGFGLVGLRERVQLVGGSLTLETAPGAGLVLRVEVPG